MGLAPRTGQVVNRQLTVGGLLWTVVSMSRDQICQAPRPGRRCSTSSPPQVSTSTLASLQEPVLGFRSSGKLLTKGPSENGSAIPMPVWCCLEHPRGTEEPEMMFPSLVDTYNTQRCRRGGSYCLLCDLPSGNIRAELAVPHIVGRS